MATGDLEGNLERLKSELRKTKFADDLDEAGLRLGDTSALLPLLRHAFLYFSRYVYQELTDSGYQLQGKSDIRVLELAIKISRDHFNLRPSLSLPQLMGRGFAERKMILLHALLTKCVGLHNQAAHQRRLAVTRAEAPQVTPLERNTAADDNLTEKAIVVCHAHPQQASSPGEAMMPETSPGAATPPAETTSASNAEQDDKVQESLQRFQTHQDALEASMQQLKLEFEQTKQQLQSRIVVLETHLKHGTKVSTATSGSQEPFQWECASTSNGQGQRMAKNACPPCGALVQHGSATQNTDRTYDPGWQPVALRDQLPVSKWAGYAATEKLIEDIHSRYTEAQALLQRFH